MGLGPSPPVSNCDRFGAKAAYISFVPTGRSKACIESAVFINSPQYSVSFLRQAEVRVVHWAEAWMQRPLPVRIRTRVLRTAASAPDVTTVRSGITFFRE